MSVSGSSGADSKALLSKVYVTDAVIQACLAHALTTEKEEVMGVLFGDVRLVPGEPPAGEASVDNASLTGGGGAPVESKVTTIWGAHAMHRNVRRSDRVEVSVEKLISASEKAEELAKTTGVTTRVVGWYHSHPRLLATPSSIDLNSQRTYQQLESGWVGLIFSVFMVGQHNTGECAVHCFQTGADQKHVHVPLVIATEPQLKLPVAIGPTSQALLSLIGEELEAAMESVKEQTDNDASAMDAARGLQQVQQYTLERMVGEPVVKYLEWCSISLLEQEVDRLEKELKSLSS